MIVSALLADAVDAAGALDQANDRPGQVVVDDDRAVLQVLALAQHVGGDQHAQFVAWGDTVALAVALRAEAPGQRGRVGGSPVTPASARMPRA